MIWLKAAWAPVAALGLMAAGELTYASAFMVGFVANSLGGAAE